MYFIMNSLLDFSNYSNYLINLRSLLDIYVYNQNNITLLGTDAKANVNTYMIQMNLEVDEDDRKLTAQDCGLVQTPDQAPDKTK